LDATGEMTVAFADMDVYEQLTPDYIEHKTSTLYLGAYFFIQVNSPRTELSFLAYLSSTKLLYYRLSAIQYRQLRHLFQNYAR